MGKYDFITDDMFHEEMVDIIKHMSSGEILAVPGVHECMREELNNQVLENLLKKKEEQEEEKEESDEWFNLEYECPDCNYQWEDNWSCGVDDTCPMCGTRDVTPHKITRIDDKEDTDEC